MEGREASGEMQRKRLGAAQEPAVDVVSLLTRATHPGQHRQQPLDRDACFTARQVSPEAEVQPETECDVTAGVAGDVEPVRR